MSPYATILIFIYFLYRVQKALEVAKLQIQNGAQILDINFDEAMLDSEASMSKFLRLIASEPGTRPLSFSVARTHDSTG